MVTSDAADPIARMPVTAVIARRPWPGREAELQAWADEFVNAASAFPGFMDARAYPPNPPDSDDLVIAMTFDCADNLSTWERSEERARMRVLARPLVMGRPRAQSVSGLEGIFGGRDRLPITPPPKWKTAIVIIVAIYPFNLLFQWLLAAHFAAWPLPVRMLPGAILAPAYVAWIGAPAVSRVLRDWLQR